MSSPRTGQISRSLQLPDAEAHTSLRAKTVATRLSVEELERVEDAAKRSGKSLAEWLRDTALHHASERPADTTELLLGELVAMRYALLNCFHSSALAASEGKHLLPESVLKIRDTADAMKLAKARQILHEFLAREVEP